MWIYLLIAEILLCQLSLSTGITITAIPGEDKVLKWTMDPVPTSSSTVVSVLHPVNKSVLFTALGTGVIPGGTTVGKRVVNTGKVNTATGHIEFTLTGITVQDAGDYTTNFQESGSATIDRVGVILVAYVKPSKPIITDVNTPVVNKTMTLECSATSNSKPDIHNQQMNYTWYIDGADLPGNNRFVVSGSQLQVVNMQKNDKDTVYTCKAYETGKLLSDVSDGYRTVVKYGPGTVSPDRAQLRTVIENADLGPFNCSAECVPGCTYQWKFNGADVGSPGNTLTIDNIQSTSAGTYSCTASNEYGTQKSKNIVVTVEYGPAIVTTSTTTELSLVENKQLGPITCSADCRPNCTYQWQFDGTDVGNPGDTLTINNIQRGSAGTYRCKASNTHNSATSDDVVVRVEYGPGTVSPNTTLQKIAIENDNIGPFYCSAECIPGCTYQWKFNGADVGSPGKTLSINNTQSKSAGTYRCTASNKYGTRTSKDITVTVEYGPKNITTNTTRELSLVENTDTLGPITCSAVCKPACVYQWQFGGADFGSSGDTLTINNIQRESAGNYWCRASNSYGTLSSSSVTVTVEYGPGTVLPNTTQHHTLIENADNLGPIECIANCVPACTYQWMLDGGHYGGRGSQLTINNIKRTAAGIYWCTASNNHGNATSARVTADVTYGPGDVSFNPNNRTYTLLEGGTLGPVTCHANCNPECSFSWTLNDTMLPDAGKVLIVENMLRYKSGIYKCLANYSYRNINETKTSSITVTVEYGPGKLFLSPRTSSYTFLENNATLNPISCNAHCLPSCSYTWTKDGVQIDANLLSQQRTAIRTMAGEYKCTAKNVHGSACVVISVTVEYAPDDPILNKSKLGGLKENDAVSLTCATDSYPLPDINITSLETNRRSHATRGSRTNTFEIPSAECLDTGKYQCTSTNKLGSTTSDEVSINVSCSPRLKDRKETDQDIYLGDNQNLNLRATIIANPRPLLSWMYSSNSTKTPTTLENSTDCFVYYEERENVVSTIRAVRPSMGERDYGTYTLNVINSVNALNVSFNVFAKRSPDPPVDGSADCYTAAATVSWKSAFNGGEQQMFIVKTAKESENLVNISWQQVDDEGMGRLHKAEIKDLDDDTTYSFRVEAHNSNGVSQYTKPLRCTTTTKKEAIETQSGTSLALIGGAAGGSTVLIVIIVLVVVLVRRRRKQMKEEDQELVNVDGVQDDPDDGMKKNILYESAGPSFFRPEPGPSGSVVDKSKGKKTDDVYAVVNKKKPAEDPSSLYAVVQKPNKGSRKGKQPLKGKANFKGGKKTVQDNSKAEVYQNVQLPAENEYGNIDGNSLPGPSNANPSSRQQNKDGLIYIDVEIVNTGKGPKINGIHGADKKVEYVDIDLTKRADPLPSSSEEEDDPPTKK